MHWILSGTTFLTFPVPMNVVLPPHPHHHANLNLEEK